MFNFRKKPEYTTISSSRPKPPADQGAAAAVDTPSDAEVEGSAEAEAETKAETKVESGVATKVVARTAAKPAKAETKGAAVPEPTPAQVREGRKLNLVDRNILLQAIDEAVRNGVLRHFKKIEPAILDQVVYGTRTELVRLLKRSSRSVRGMPKSAFLKEVEEDRARILAERNRVFGELEAMKGQLEQRRVEVDKIQLRLVRESRMEGIAKDEALAQRIFELFGGHGASHEMAAVREQITFMLLQSLQVERDKVIDAQMSEHRKEVENFERRIAKLNESLELTEEELQRIAKAKGIDPGVASIYRTVQGLSSDIDNAEARREMMSSIFEANLQLQKGTAA